MRWWSAAALAVAVLASSPAAAEIVITPANCLSIDNPSTARVVRTFAVGDVVSVANRRDGYAFVTPDNCWLTEAVTAKGDTASDVASRGIDTTAPSDPSTDAGWTAILRRLDTPPAGLTRRSSEPVRSGSSSVVARRRKASSARSLLRPSSSGNCPCNGGAVCVGPRGGRYCITSGGAKRYGV